MDNDKSHTSAGSVQSDSNERSTINVGHDNTFTGGVQSTDNSTDSHDITETKSNSENTTITKNNSENTSITNNTTIYESKKSESEILEENLRAYRFECRRQYKNGLISKEGQSNLLELQRRYNLPDEFIKPVEEDVREKSKKPIEQLSLNIAQEINKTKTIIEQNSSSEIQRHLTKLQSWVREYDDDTLKFWYYHLSSMLEPARYSERYEESSKDEYWEVYWAFIAYMLQNKVERAYKVQASLGRLQPFYPGMPEQNDYVLALSGRLIQNDSIENIKSDYNTHAICTRELTPLLRSIDCLLQMDWTREEPIVHPTQSFYANTLFKSFVETQKKRGEEIRKERERISREEKEKQKELQRQKDLLLKKFQELEDVDKACKVLDIPYYTTFQDWLNEDPSFKSKYNEIICRIEERIRNAREQEERIRQQKEQFKQKYKQNICDTLKTCSDLGIGSDTVEDWKNNDKAFADALAIIDREHKKQQQDLFIQFYEANGCDVQKSCAETGICEDEYSDWRRSDKSFAEVLSAIEREHIKELKVAFVECYRSNYNVLSSCKEVGLSPDDIREWRKQDSSFDESLKLIEKNHADLVRKALLTKILPWLLIVALSIACVFGIMRVVYSYNESKDKTEIEGQYDLAVSDFNTAFSNIDTSDEGLDALSNAAIALKRIFGLEQSPHLEGRGEFLSLKRKFDERVEELLENFQNKASLIPEKGGNEIVWKDGEQGQKRVKEIINTLQQ